VHADGGDRDGGLLAGQHGDWIKTDKRDAIRLARLFAPAICA
jgi:hypothetical protein